MGRLLHFLLIYLAQRTLGPVRYGHLTVAVASGLVLVPLADLGCQLVITRRLARGDQAPAALVGAGLVVKAAVTGLLALALAMVTATRPPGVRLAAFGLGLAVLVGAFGDFFGAVFRGLQRVDVDAALGLIGRATTAALGVWVIARGGGLNGLAVAYLTGAAVGALGGATWLGTRFFRPALAAGLAEIRPLVREAAPLGVGLVVSMLYTRTAVFLLDAWHGPAAAGVFGVALKLIEPLSLLPAALLAAVFPAFAAALATGRDAGRVRALALRTLAATGAAVAGVGVLLGPRVVALLYGAEYAAAARPLQILAAATLPVFLNYGLTHFVIAEGRHGWFLAATAVTCGLNAGLCLAWVPRYGPAGAAAAMLIAEVALTALCWRAGRSVAPLGAIEPRVPPYE